MTNIKISIEVDGIEKAKRETSNWQIAEMNLQSLQKSYEHFEEEKDNQIKQDVNN